MSFYLKDPDALVDHAIDWSAYLGDRTIVASAWSIDPDEEGGVAIAESSFDTGRAAARADGGIAGHVYRLTNRVTLSDGSEDERSLALRVEER